MNDAEIGAALGLPQVAVQDGVAAILEKMGVSGRTQAAIRALKLGSLRL